MLNFTSVIEIALSYQEEADDIDPVVGMRKLVLKQSLVDNLYDQAMAVVDTPVDLEMVDQEHKDKVVGSVDELDKVEAAVQDRECMEEEVDQETVVHLDGPYLHLV